MRIWVAHLTEFLWANRKQAQAVMASAIVPDTTPPVLISFDLSVSSSSLTLYFDEPVNASSLLPSQVSRLVLSLRSHAYEYLKDAARECNSRCIARQSTYD